MTQVIHQNIIHHNVINENDNTQLNTVIHVKTSHSIINHNIIKNKAKAVQSLNKLSHSNIKVSLLGAHIDLNIAKTATGSVADISDQNSKQTKNGISNHISGNIKNINIATINAEINNHIIDNILMLFQLYINCLYFIL